MIEDSDRFVDELKDKAHDLYEENKELKQKVKYYENFEINKTVDKIRLENNKREKELQERLQQKENTIKTFAEDLDKQIIFCTNEADGTTNDKICRITIQYLKHLKGILDKEVN